MISRSNLEQQLKKINFNSRGWGRSEVRELCNVLMPDEPIEECVNGYYEAGFALLVATKDRVLLIDKKPLNYLVVEDIRFDMISEFDYSHRIIGAQIKITAGMKTLHFMSLNQPRLRRLLNFVQCHMTEIKRKQQGHQEAQKDHLEQMNQQLQMYLAIQHYHLQQQQLINQQQQQFGAVGAMNMAKAQLAGHMSPEQVGIAAVKRVVPVISAYTRLPWMSERRRYQSYAA